jgi:N-formylglutamate deformylase
MTPQLPEWLEVHRGNAPLVVAFPHTGVDIPAALERDFVSVWHAIRDADWWIDRLYGFVRDLGVTTVRTRISRSVIDVNRDPSGASLYPGHFTTGLCPTTDFDGGPLYGSGQPDEAEIDRRRSNWFEPYHQAIGDELARLRALHDRVVIYDAHSIRSHIPSLFDGELPQFNIGTAGGTTCAPALLSEIDTICGKSGLGHVVDGRFKGGWTTRHYGQPESGVHAVQMELAQRGYMAEPSEPTSNNWPTLIDPDPSVLPILKQVIAACLSFAKGNR